MQQNVVSSNLKYENDTDILCFADVMNLTVTKESQLNRVLANMLLFERLAIKRLKQQIHETEMTQSDSSCSDAKRRKMDGDFIDKGDNSQSVCDIEDCVITKDFPCISSALTWATQGKEPNISSQSFIEIPSKLRNADHIQILVTGSLHLVGGVLGLIGPE